MKHRKRHSAERGASMMEMSLLLSLLLLVAVVGLPSVQEGLGKKNCEIISPFAAGFDENGLGGDFSTTRTMWLPFDGEMGCFDLHTGERYFRSSGF